jgi:hypothetical protein
VRKAHFGPLATVLSPLGLPLFVFLLLRSQNHTRWRKEVRWKGRTYRPATKAPEMRQYKGEATSADRR